MYEQMNNQAPLKEQTPVRTPLSSIHEGLRNIFLETGPNNGMRLQKDQRTDSVVFEALLGKLKKEGLFIPKTDSPDGYGIFVNKDEKYSRGAFDAVAEMMKSPEMISLVDQRKAWRDEQDKNYEEEIAHYNAEASAKFDKDIAKL